MNLAIVQARLGSSRLPKKVLLKIKDLELINILLYRLSKSKKIDKIIVATTTDEIDDELEKIVKEAGYDVYRGSKEDVLDRYYQAAKIYHPKNVIRITGDCPLIDSEIVDEVITTMENSNFDNCNNTYPPTFPDGLDLEIFTFETLQKSWQQSTDIYDREHVTPFMHHSKQFNVNTVSNSKDLSSLRWTVDEKVDFDVVNDIFNHFENLDFSWKDVLELYHTNNEIFEKNMNIKRNEGSKLGSGQKLWKRAKTIIPGGNMLLSKRAEMFLPEYWPAYFSKAKGCEVWDLDNNKFIDMSIMGIGTNTLGYGHEKVDEAVLNIIKKGNMSTLNCPEEVYLAEKLIELHPWADMARFTRTGGEANAVAVRIARAASGKDGVAFCGYHGWHDWYLATNIRSKNNLDGHLLSGLDSKGVPKELEGTIYPFEYNNYNELQKIIDSGSIGVIFMEVMRNHAPNDNFLQKVRDLATKNGIVLVFDECTSGFRENFGGLHLKYNVYPDIAMFGKALGNGYAINAIIGRREVMEIAQSTFISSTFWTERIGPSAALATLKVMEEEKSWEIISKIGSEMKMFWKNVFNNNNIKINISGLDALASYSIEEEYSILLKTYLTQELLKKGYLSSNSFYSSITHNSNLLSTYFEDFENVLTKFNPKLLQLLDGPECHVGFKRLN